MTNINQFELGDKGAVEAIDRLAKEAKEYKCRQCGGYFDVFPNDDYLACTWCDSGDVEMAS